MGILKSELINLSKNGRRTSMSKISRKIVDQTKIMSGVLSRMINPNTKKLVDVKE